MRKNTNKKMEGNIRMMKSSDELGENNKSIKENRGKAQN